MASQSATFVAIGFSTSTCLPRSAAAITCSACAWCGDATMTASTSDLDNSASSDGATSIP